jgi:hypothetical protein
LFIASGAANFQWACDSAYSREQEVPGVGAQDRHGRERGLPAAHFVPDQLGAELREDPRVCLLEWLEF